MHKSTDMMTVGVMEKLGHLLRANRLHTRGRLARRRVRAPTGWRVDARQHTQSQRQKGGKKEGREKRREGE